MNSEREIFLLQHQSSRINKINVFLHILIADSLPNNNNNNEGETLGAAKIIFTKPSTDSVENQTADDSAFPDVTFKFVWNVNGMFRNSFELKFCYCTLWILEILSFSSEFFPVSANEMVNFQPEPAVTPT